MKHVWFAASIACLLACGGRSAKETAILKPHPVFTIHKGTNISHWLSQSERRGEERRAWFGKEDVAFLAKTGFDHLRLPVDEEQLWSPEGKMEEEAFGLLNAALDWCAEYDLRAVVDLHILRSHHFNEAVKPLWTDPKAQERLVQCWRDLSSRLKDRPVGKVAYELMNEAVADDHGRAQAAGAEPRHRDRIEPLANRGHVR